MDRASGDVSVVTGTEAGSPTAPAVPEGKVPVAQVLLQTPSASITNSMITDERVLNALGLGSIAFQNANNVSITGGSITGITDLAVADGGTGASNAAGARANLGAAASGANSDITSLSGLTTPLSVAQGGSGAATFTDGGVLIGNGTGAMQATSAGATGQVLTSNGAGSDPTFQAIPAAAPVGAGALWFAASPPAGWLICDGAAISRSTYSVLFALIGTNFGAGNGSTTFNLPNFANRFPLGVGTFSLANTGGAFSRNASDVPVHSHSHSLTSSSTSSAGAHTHTLTGAATYAAPPPSGDGSGNPGFNGDVSPNSVFQQIESSGAHTHTLTGTTSAASVGSTLDVTNPYLAIYFIIKT